MLREEGVAVFCDGFDRTNPAFQKKVSVELSNLLRDYPSMQLFVFSRGSATPSLELPVVELLPLSEEQVRRLSFLLFGLLEFRPMPSRVTKKLGVRNCAAVISVNLWRAELF